MKKIVVPLLVSIILVLAVSGNIQTSSLNPSQIDLCGEHQNYVTLTATGITNQVNDTLTQVKAKLMITGSSGLSYITSQEVNIGDLAPLGSSSIDPQWTIQCNTPNSGTYAAYVDYASTNGYTASSIGQAESVLIVHQVDPLEVEVSVIEGESTVIEDDLPAIIADNTPTINVDTNRDAICKGTLDVDEAYEDMDFIFFGTQTEHEYTFPGPLSEGLHTVYVKCKDSFDYTMQISTEIRFIIDTNPPIITIESPLLPITEDYADLVVRTNEVCTCRYSTKDKSYGDMTSFDENNDTYFKSSLEDLEVGDDKYYIKCRDEVGNEAEKTHTISVELPPTVTISINKKPPLKAGTYEVSVLPSKKLRSTPILSYSFTDSPSFSRYVSLEKVGSNLFTGYMIIEEYELDRVGVFTYQGTDIDGVVGSEITDGKTFLVDTLKPPAITSIEAKADVLGDITIKWFYDVEQVEKYNIYRSVSGNTDYIHLYTSTADDIYIDTDVQNGVTYYYKVAAIDGAGNIGELSKEISAKSTKRSGTDITEEPTNSGDPPKQSTLKRYNDTLKLMERLMIDLDWADTNMREKRTSEKIVDNLNLVKDIQDSIQSVDKLRRQLQALDPNEETDTSLRNTLQNAENLISTIEKTTPSKFEVTKKATFVQTITESDIKSLVDEMLIVTNYTDKQKRKFAEVLFKLHDDIKIDGEVQTLEIEYINGLTENKVYVSKKASYESPESLQNIQLIEVIPKTVAGNADEIDIRTPDYVVLKQDPIISWTYDSLTYDKRIIEYIILSSDNSESAKSSKTIVYIDPSTVIKPSSNIITGFVTKVVENSPFGFVELIGLLIGILVVSGLLMYYFVSVKEIPFEQIWGKIPIVNKIKKPVFSNVLKKNKNQVKQPIQQRRPVVPIQTQPVKSKININRQPEHDEKKQVSSIVYQMVPPSKYFFLVNGDVIRSIEELKDILRNMDYMTFTHHVNYHKNDFAEWIRGVYNINELANKLQFLKNREEIIEEIENYNY